MKKLRKKLRKLNNSGSSIVMVIVALAFLAIIVGSLLSAAGYAYKLKFQDLNSKNNYYYVEQAMNEVYAGVGSDTMDSIREAYIYTVEHMTYYDADKKMYVTLKDDECQDMFADKFIELFCSASAGSYYSSDALAKSRIEKFITNDTVKFDPSKLLIEYEKESGNIKTVILKNITLNRTQEYKKSVANGTFTQTLSADIVIGRPDFKVIFNSTNSDYSNLFNYAMIADMGVEVNQPLTPLTINGNLYAANDFYNKKYNVTMYDDTAKQETTLPGADAIYSKYKHIPVTSKVKNSTRNDYYNAFDSKYRGSAAKYFDGENANSMYSGLYIQHSDVSIIADRVIVPGTIAVMDRGTLSVNSRNGKLTSVSEIWADNIVLGGFSSKTYSSDDTTKKNPIYSGSSAIIKGDLYVRDDTELNAAGSKFVLNGGYYGYGDSTTKDTREYISTVNADDFVIEEKDDAGETVKRNRGHYNSSAIIVNGEKSDLDFSLTDNLFLAGRSYIELSKKVDRDSSASFEEKRKLADGTTSNVNLYDVEGNVVTSEDGVTQTYEYNPKESIEKADGSKDTVFIRDYKTGESISSAANQKAYVPVTYKTMPEKAATPDPELGDYFEAILCDGLKGSALFEKYFPKKVFDDKIPCIMQSVSGKKYFYLHFEKAYKELKNYAGILSDETKLLISDNTSPESYAASFIEDYSNELNSTTSSIKEYLVDIGNFEDFKLGQIVLPKGKSKIYSSGAITSKEETKFSIKTSDAVTDLKSLFDGNAYVTSTTSASSISKEIGKEYEYVKWNLDHYKDAEAGEKSYVDALVNNGDFGDAIITPINKYLDFSKITSSTNYNSSLTDIKEITADTNVWISNSDVIVSDDDGDKTVTGVVITKGDVQFASNVEHFNGLIVCGGKLYITNNLKTIQASPQTCMSFLRNCRLSNNEAAKKILELFRQEADTLVTPGSSETARTIDTIDYSDVVSFNNWMKNVE